MRVEDMTGLDREQLAELAARVQVHVGGWSSKADPSRSAWSARWCAWSRCCGRTSPSPSHRPGYRMLQRAPRAGHRGPAGQVLRGRGCTGPPEPGPGLRAAELLLRSGPVYRPAAERAALGDDRGGAGWAAGRGPARARRRQVRRLPRNGAGRPYAGGSSRPSWRATYAARPSRYQRPWTTVPLCSVTTFLPLAVQAMKAGRSCQVSTACFQCSTTPAGDS